MYGNALDDEALTAAGPFRPRSPYGTAKLFAHRSAINYRESYDMFVSTGILFNHESPRRGAEFVTRKICIGAALASKGRREPLRLGNLDARRDWGWAPDYVEAMVRMLSHDVPLDLMVATGVSHSVRDLCAAAYGAVGLDWQDHVVVDPAFLRPAELHVLVGDPSEAEATIGWRPTVSFQVMVERMVQAELSRA
jgi:GDPmannose 4,6-dehydratase